MRSILGHALLTILLVVAVTAGAAADPTGLYVKSGGTLAMIGSHPDVALRDEVVSFLIGYSGAAVRVELNFENTGAAQEVLMGFPVFPGMGAVSDLLVSADGSSLATSAAPQDVENAPTMRVNSYAIGAQWYLFKVAFAEHQRRHLKVAYNQLHSAKSYGGPILRYWLGTGANWKGNIDFVEIRVAAVDPDNWRDISTGFATAVNGKLIYRMEDYDGAPADFTVSATPAAAAYFMQGGTVSSGPRSYGFFDGRVLAESDFLAAALCASCSKSPDAKQLVFSLTRVLDENDIASPATLVARIRPNDDPLSQLLWGWCFARNDLRQYVAGATPSPALLNGCVAALNRVCFSGILLSRFESLFGNRPPSARLLAMKDAKPTGRALVAFNRLALSELLPGVIRESEVQEDPQKASVPVLPGPEFAEAFAVKTPTPIPGDWVDVEQVARQLGLHFEVRSWAGQRIIEVADPRVPRK